MEPSSGAGLGQGQRPRLATFRQQEEYEPVKTTAVSALLCLSLSAAAVAGVPKPKLRPAEAPPSQAERPSDPVPVPRLRPLEPEPPSAKAEAGKPDKDQNEPADGRRAWPASLVAAGRAECHKLLDGLDIAYSPLDPLGEEGGCGAPAPILVTKVSGIKLSPPATLTCNMAAALHEWLTEDVKPAARLRLSTEVTEIRTATSYACRRRNNASSGKMSEHSKANALDMSGFTFAKTSDVAVGGQGNWGQSIVGPVKLSSGGSFLGDIRLKACTHFTTVLGPGSDPYHGDHFHVDWLQRKGGYRICQ